MSWFDAQHRAFTLIEVMVCMVIVATLAALAAVNLRAGRRTVDLRAALVELQSEDRTLRDHARQSGEGQELVFDVDSGEVNKVQLDEQGHEKLIPLAAFGDHARIKEVMLADKKIGGGSVRLDCSRAGRFPSYAVLVTAGEEKQWIIVPSMTGQFVKIDSEEQVEEIFAQLRGKTPASNDAG